MNGRIPNRIESLPEDGPDAEEAVRHLNALMDCLKWYRERGVGIEIKTTERGYTMNFKAADEEEE